MGYRAPVRRSTLLMLLAACSGAADNSEAGPSGEPTVTLSGAASAAPTSGTGDVSSGEVGSTTTSGGPGPGETGGESDTGGPGTTGVGTTGPGLPPLRDCDYPATNFGGGMLELMVEQGSRERLEFTVPGLPDPAVVTAATLRFVSWDADHAGEEGLVYVNDGPGLELPAAAAWENAEHASELSVTGRTIAGPNTIGFGAGSLADGSFYRIGDVALAVTAHVDACPDAPAMPPKSAQIDYPDAIYTQRGNWVHRCDFIPPYAYTADGDHASEDCDGLYDPDGSSEGTATFVFNDLAPAMYKITIQSRHSANRNPAGALFIVDGEERRVDQTVGSDVVVDEWGTKQLAGTIEVVLDSSLDSESDSVAWVRLDPV
jgi:hypothetical protein